jgi:hypothetical protein
MQLDAIQRELGGCQSVRAAVAASAMTCGLYRSSFGSCGAAVAACLAPVALQERTNGRGTCKIQAQPAMAATNRSR